MTNSQLIADLVDCLEYKEDMAHVQVIEGKGAVFWETMYALKRAAHEPSEQPQKLVLSKSMYKRLDSQGADMSRYVQNGPLPEESAERQCTDFWCKKRGPKLHTPVYCDDCASLRTNV